MKAQLHADRCISDPRQENTQMTVAVGDWRKNKLGLHIALSYCDFCEVILFQCDKPHLGGPPVYK